MAIDKAIYTGRATSTGGRTGTTTASVSLAVTIPGVERAVAEALVAAAHQVCPYSNATRGNIDVTLSVV
jgi:organic hydroperoxide reductase OsmC/OhrA